MYCLVWVLQMYHEPGEEGVLMLGQYYSVLGLFGLLEPASSQETLCRPKETHCGQLCSIRGKGGEISLPCGGSSCCLGTHRIQQLPTRFQHETLVRMACLPHSILPHNCGRLHEEAEAELIPQFTQVSFPALLSDK